MEGLIFGGAYLRREICFTLYLRAIFQVQAPGGAYIWRSDLTEGFLNYRIGEAYIWRGLYMEGLIFGILRYLDSYGF